MSHKIAVGNTGDKVVTSLNDRLDSLNGYNIVSNSNFADGELGWVNNYSAFSGDKSIIQYSTPVGDKAFKYLTTAASGLGLWFFVPLTSDIVEGDTLRYSILIKKSCADTLNVKVAYCLSNRTSIAGGSTYSLSGDADTWILVGTYTKAVPASAAYLRFIVDGVPDATTLHVANLEVVKVNTSLDYILPKNKYVSRSSVLIYVDGTSGDDTNVGSSNFPLQTLTAACILAANSEHAKIILKAGDYREQLKLAYFTKGDYEIIADEIAKVRIMGSTALSSFAKTGGATNVYEAAWTGSVLSYTNVLAAGDSVKVIFEDGRPSKTMYEDSSSADDTNDFQPFQRGLENRLPYTVLYPQTSIANCDANPGSFYFDDANDKIYVHTSDSDDPSSNGYSYEVSVRSCNSYPSTYQANLKLTGIQFWFSSLNGCDLTGFNNVERRFCTVLGAKSTGFFDGAAKVISWKDEAGGNFIDGFGSDINHITDYDLQDMRTAYTLSIYHDPWGHDNGDDGISHHRRGEVTIYGGLFEYNGDNGVIPSYGSNCTAYNVISRENNQLSGNSGGGFVAAGTADGGRFFAILNAYGCLAEGNKYGFNAQSPNKVNCYNCLSKDNDTYEYIAAGDGVITLYNCSYKNDDSGKAQSNARVITTTLVT